MELRRDLGGGERDVLFGTETNLDIARALFELGGVLFGEFDLGPTAGRSPIYINPRVLISEPALLRRIAHLIHHEIQADQARRRPRLASFAAVAGVPMGGLHLATAYALVSDTPLIYVRPDAQEPALEGRIVPGQTVLVIDDLMTGGTSLLRTARILEEAGLTVRDFIVLIDREQGGAERLHAHGYHVMPILRLRTMLTYYFESGMIDSQRYRTAMDYLERTNRRG
ncbi:MAG: phosphoribosyltransferase [Thermomicrobium sp.]|uniref:orotate phosphoribosyltransferase n=1 Tax=Thermomicrobium sp. TaxID=1969469 RepID=UPI001B24B88D|nr:phosphoribosyltransferase family protein [Thermomicrobium sp.]MBO9358443.1 phosphoribosyltransferase [Thermomicrobium sp.]